VFPALAAALNAQKPGLLILECHVKRQVYRGCKMLQDVFSQMIVTV
jgi:hypothetical protein